MAGVFMNINGPIVADTVYVDNKLVAKDVEFTLPEVAFVAAEVEAMGTLSLPIMQRLDNMETTISKIGLDLGFKAMLKPESKRIEFRFPQEVLDQNGKTKIVACKAFITCMNSKIPGIGVVPGEASTNEVTQTVTRYQLFVNGGEYLLIDRLAGIVRIDGTDYAAGVQSML